MEEFEFKNFKPILFPNDNKEIKDISYDNLMASTKLDGVRVIMTYKGLYARSLKPIKNKALQEKFAETCRSIPKDLIIDGEIWSPKMACGEISGIVNRKNDKVPESINIHMFDCYDYTRPNLTLKQRLGYLQALQDLLQLPMVVYNYISSKNVLEAFYEKAIQKGYEGVVARKADSKYKFGRVTSKSGEAVKLKPYSEEDVTIIDVNERYENTNESQTNELGYSYKRNTKDAKKRTGVAATLQVKDKEGVEFKAALSGSLKERRKILEHKDFYKGRTAVVKSLKHGVKEKPRHPVVLRIK